MRSAEFTEPVVPGSDWVFCVPNRVPSSLTGNGETGETPSEARSTKHESTCLSGEDDVSFAWLLDSKSMWKRSKTTNAARGYASLYLVGLFPGVTTSDARRGWQMLRYKIYRSWTTCHLSLFGIHWGPLMVCLCLPPENQSRTRSLVLGNAGRVAKCSQSFDFSSNMYMVPGIDSSIPVSKGHHCVSFNPDHPFWENMILNDSKKLRT